ncbi:phosphate ABC transporter substrate-binding protein [Arsukibacterium sp.]|uniref:phosphate ABC transporter substrate-binding protein n=1 Tax=Arsukibacterium sp. TaxID=1977258 RepID=UPI002FDB07A9
MLRILSMLMVLGWTNLACADIVVIVNPAFTGSVTTDELARLYTGRSSSLTAVNLAESQAIRAEFDQKGVGRSSAQLKAYWSKLVFTGKGSPPKELTSEAEMLTLIASDPQAIGYVSSANVNDSVKVILTLN